MPTFRPVALLVQCVLTCACAYACVCTCQRPHHHHLHLLYRLRNPGVLALLLLRPSIKSPPEIITDTTISQSAYHQPQAYTLHSFALIYYCCFLHPRNRPPVNCNNIDTCDSLICFTQRIVLNPATSRSKTANDHFLSPRTRPST
jgi:hypothetical protein